MSTEKLAGYTFGTPAVARSPVSLAELALLEDSVGWSPADAEALRNAGVILEDQIEAILDTWLSPVRALPFLAAYYGTSDGMAIDEHYFTVVRARFGQWIRDTATGSTIRPGSTTSMRSASAITARRRIARTARRRHRTSRCVT
jgi:hypothetical protein